MIEKLKENRVIKFLKNINIIIWFILVFIINIISIPFVNLDMSTEPLMVLLTLLISAFLLNATLALLSFTYLSLFKNDKLDFEDKEFEKLSYPSFWRKRKDIKKELAKFGTETEKVKEEYHSLRKKYGEDENIPPEDNTKLSNELDELSKKRTEIEDEMENLDSQLTNYRYKLILRSGEYFFLSTTFLILGFIFLGINFVVTHFIPNPDASDVLIRSTILFAVIALLIFIRGIINTLMFFGHVGIVKDIN